MHRSGVVALLLTVALMGALMACEPPSRGRCVEWGVKSVLHTKYVNGKARQYWRSETVCTRYEQEKM